MVDTSNYTSNASHEPSNSTVHVIWLFLLLQPLLYLFLIMFIGQSMPRSSSMDTKEFLPLVVTLYVVSFFDIAIALLLKSKWQVRSPYGSNFGRSTVVLVLVLVPALYGLVGGFLVGPDVIYLVLPLFFLPYPPMTYLMLRWNMES